MKPTFSMLTALIGLAAAGAAQAQDAPPEAQTETLAAPAAPATADWHPFSRSPTRVYMVDVGGMAVREGVATARIARVPLDAVEAADYSHVAEDFELRCDTGESRTTVTTEYGPDGVQIDQYEDPSPWEAIRENSLDEYLKGVVCDGNRSPPPTWPTIQAFIDAGRR